MSVIINRGIDADITFKRRKHILKYHDIRMATAATFMIGK